ncbi:hypothetical protein LVD15_18580 [Fulvivirga maritima]|uniref:hypothetical protein n=1 Tax=Fulvivirga maritima TaxID=2904247 RepID=UPI001F18FB00|nr:hypothetical protein [Fulvivirga maritima]UII25296.1 hypothetical protein LVD15_18580 [Fulvivirga maritima]
MIKHFFSPKRQRIIESVKDYYNGKIERVPYSEREIAEVARWIEDIELPNKEMLIAKFNMITLIKSKK